MMELIDISETKTNKLLLRYYALNLEGFCYLRMSKEFRKQILHMADLATLANGYLIRFCSIKSYVPNNIKLTLISPDVKLERLSSHLDFIANFYTEKSFWYLNNFNELFFMRREEIDCDIVIVEVRGDDTFSIEFFPYPNEALQIHRAFTALIPIDTIR